MDKVAAKMDIEKTLAYIVEHMATKEDLAEMRQEITDELTGKIKGVRTELKGDILSLRTQLNSIEIQVRTMNHGRLEMRVADLEEKVFGKGR